MGFWSKAETELHLNIAGDEPRRVLVATNWQYYITRFERCEGFELSESSEPAEGGRRIDGVLDQSEFKYLWLRTSFGSEAAERRFWDERKKLGEPQTQVGNEAFRIGAHERETHFMAVADDPYWLVIETDAAYWQRILGEHPYAVLVAQSEYGNDALYQRFMFPRSLMTVRRQRPQYSEEHLEALRERFAASRAK